jgi:hypothetical protein
MLSVLFLDDLPFLQILPPLKRKYELKYYQKQKYLQKAFLIFMTKLVKIDELMLMINLKKKKIFSAKYTFYCIEMFVIFSKIMQIRCIFKNIQLTFKWPLK